MTDRAKGSWTPGCPSIYAPVEWKLCFVSVCGCVCAVRTTCDIYIYIYIHLTSIYTCIQVPTPADRKAPSTSPLWVLKETKTWNTAKWEVCPMVRAVRLWCTTALSQQAKIGIPIDWHTFCRKQENSFGLYTIRMPTHRIVSFFLPPSLSYKKQIYIYIYIYIRVYIYTCAQLCTNL